MSSSSFLHLKGETLQDGGCQHNLSSLHVGLVTKKKKKRKEKTAVLLLITLKGEQYEECDLSLENKWSVSYASTTSTPVVIPYVVIEQPWGKRCKDNYIIRWSCFLKIWIMCVFIWIMSSQYPINLEESISSPFYISFSQLVVRCVIKKKMKKIVCGRWNFEPIARPFVEPNYYWQRAS